MSQDGENGQGLHGSPVRGAEPTNGGQAPARQAHNSATPTPAHGWSPTANWPLGYEQIKLGVLKQIQHEASKGGPNELKPPTELHEFARRCDLVFYDENHNPVKVAYALAAWS